MRPRLHRMGKHGIKKQVLFCGKEIADEKERTDLYLSYLLSRICDIFKRITEARRGKGKATLMLSTMSNNFESLKERVESTGMFREVIMFEEKERTFPGACKIQGG